MWLPVTEGVTQRLLEEAHKSKLSIHPGDRKMYRDLKFGYWWPYMKREIAWFVERCLSYRKVKAEHQQAHGNVQPLPIPMSK